MPTTIMPTIQSILALLLSALPLMGGPGPATMSLAAAGAAFGARRSTRYLAGVVLGTIACLLLVASGLAGLMLAAPGLGPAIALAAAAYLLFLAWRIATAPPFSIADRDAPAPSFAVGFLLAIANPKAYAAIGAVYSSHTLLADAPGFDASAKIALLSTVIVIVNLGWLLIGGALAHAAPNPRAGRALNILFAVLLIVSVAMASLV